MTTNNSLNFKETLDQSCDELSPTIEQQLNARRNLAQTKRITRSWIKVVMTALPLALVLTLWLQFPTQQQETEHAVFYEDIDYLLEEEEIDFLADMDVSNWLIELDDIEESG